MAPPALGTQEHKSYGRALTGQGVTPHQGGPPAPAVRNLAWGAGERGIGERVPEAKGSLRLADGLE